MTSVQEARDLGVDIDRVSAWMDRADIGYGPCSDITVLRGGTQNILVRFRRGGEEFILRRPPHHPLSDGGKTAGFPLLGTTQFPRLKTT
jgi:hypothetical protein